MKRLIVGLLVIGVMSLGSIGEADARRRGAKKNRVRRQVFDFDGDNIEGSLLTPAGEFLSGRLRPKHKSLIEYRFNFTAEMLKTAEDI